LDWGTVTTENRSRTDKLIGLKIVLPLDIAERLRDRASASGITESRLAALLVKAIARDNLYEAVLGD
jgi:hypothetical protein